MPDDPSWIADTVRAFGGKWFALAAWGILVAGFVVVKTMPLYLEYRRHTKDADRRHQRHILSMQAKLQRRLAKRKKDTG
jgi:hypothetical protein